MGYIKLTASEAEIVFGCSRMTLYLWVRRGLLKHSKKRGKAWFVAKTEIDERKRCKITTFTEVIRNELSAEVKAWTDVVPHKG